MTDMIAMVLMLIGPIMVGIGFMIFYYKHGGDDEER